MAKLRSFVFVLVVIIQSDIKNISTPMRNEVLAAVCVLYLNDVGRDTHSVEGGKLLTNKIR